MSVEQRINTVRAVVLGVPVYLEQSRWVWVRDYDFPRSMCDNVHLRERGFVTKLSWPPSLAGLVPTSAPEGFSLVADRWGPLEQETYAKLRGKLYKGSAALGVTMASWRQSREMIVDRYRQLSLQSDSFERRAHAVIKRTRLSKNSRRVNIELSKLGGQYLELVFGWQPLLTDIHAAASTVIHTRPQTQRVTARARGHVEGEWVIRPGQWWRTHKGVIRCTRSATVEISNPNLYLADRAGLLNPAAVAWDLVPWSWVVNLFSNIGTLVNSVTDFAGLSFPSSSITRTADLVHTETYRVDGVGSAHGTYHTDYKYRDLNGVARPPLILRVPEVNWGLAAIAASVFAQKFRRLDNLMSFVQHK